MSSLRFRPGTLDQSVWESVFNGNEYLLPDRIDGAIVVDIGLHIGSFAALCKMRGAAEIFGVELSIGNLQLALHNVAITPGYATLAAYHAAAWRSDCRGARLAFGGHDGINTGGAWTVPMDDAHEEIPSMPLDDLLKVASDFGRRRIDYLKIDCEGAEWPILFTSRCLHWIDHIAGEYHAGADIFEAVGPKQRVVGIEYSLDALAALLAKHGFDAEIEPPNDYGYNHFWAHRN